jgi:hypothetical protein
LCLRGLLLPHLSSSGKMPAVHIYTDLPLVGRSVRNLMHLIALFDLNCALIQAYNVGETQTMHEDGNFAQSAYTLMREEVKRAAQQEKFDE